MTRRPPRHSTRHRPDLGAQIITALTVRRTLGHLPQPLLRTHPMKGNTDVTTYGTLQGRLTITIAGQSVDMGRVDVPIRGRVNGSEIALKADLREVRDAVEAIFATTTTEPDLDWGEVAPLLKDAQAAAADMWAAQRQSAPAPEPDPWPTAPLIVADWTSGGVEGGRGLLYRETDADQYWTIRENESVYPEHTGDTLTNVVPVTVVPTAEWEALVTKWDEKKYLGYGENTAAEAVAHLIAATAALDAPTSPQPSTR